MLVHVFRGGRPDFRLYAKRNGGEPAGTLWALDRVQNARDEQRSGSTGMTVDACQDDIDAYGFHLTDAHVRITQHATS